MYTPYSYNLVLVGFMGCGKSTIAQMLQERHHMELIEMDELIAHREGKSIPMIFQEHGEAYFRNLETKLLIEMQDHTNAIISCGGGVPLRDENVLEMKRNGKVILLTARPETILERLKNDHNRPLLQGRKTVEGIAELLNARKEKYIACADMTIATDGLTPEEICCKIEETLESQD